MPEKHVRPYGLWDSQISAQSISQALGFSDTGWDESGSLVWLERRSDRGVLVVQPPGDHAWRDLNSSLSVRGRVGYGGGDFAVGRGQATFAEAASGRLYRQPLASGPAQPVTPAFGEAASPAISPDGRWLLYVHTYEGQDSLAVVDAQGQGWPAKLAEGHDFYMQPTWHPSGQRVAWISWNHPNMPWDGTFLHLSEVASGDDGRPPRVQQVETIAGGPQTSVIQPCFSPDGRSLAYISDESGWWQIYLHDMETGQARQLTSEQVEHGEPAWVQGMRSLQFSPDSRSLYYLLNRQGFSELWVLDLHSEQKLRLEIDPAFTWLNQPAISPDGKRMALIASGGTQPAQVISLSLGGGFQTLRRSTSDEVDPSAYSVPQPITWQGLDGGPVYGIFYPPHNPRFEASGRPPLIVYIHGGPTSQVPASFDARAQFFTSRGYAVLNVNYRGSTGYGSAYRNALRGNWGVYDVEDSVSGVRSLADQGLVDAERAVILGGSAGGFTVLKAMEDYPGFFKAGVCMYGVSNQFTLAADTHKFEAHYSDTLLGSLPEAAEIYRQRSPIFFVDQIVDPIIIFQGEDDRVVPRDQSDEVVASLRQRGVPHEYHLYPGEGHGFRKSETIEDFYRKTERFLRQYVIFS